MEAAPHAWPALGVLLLRDGLVSKDGLEAILDEQRDARQQRVSGRQLGEILIARGIVTPAQVAKLVAEQYELPFVELDTSDIDLRVASLLTEELARHFSAVPIETRPDGSYLLAIADPATVLFSDELRRVLGSTPHFAVVGPDALEAAIAFVHDRPGEHPVAAESPDTYDGQGVVIDFRPEESTTASPSGDDLYFGASRTVAHLWPPLGALLIREGLLSDEELERALAQQRLSTSWRLGEILVDRGVVTPSAVARLVAEQYELPFVELSEIDIDPAAATLLPKEIAQEYPAVPIAARDDGSLEVAIADPTNVFNSDALRRSLGVPLTFVVAAADAIAAVLEAVHAPAPAPEAAPSEEHAEDELAVDPVVDADEPPAVEDAHEVSHDPDALPDFVIEAADSAAVEDAEEISGEEDVLPDVVDEVVVTPSPSWTTELALADDVLEIDEPEVDHEQPDTVVDDLAAILLAEATSTEDVAEPLAFEETPEPPATVALAELELDEEVTESTELPDEHVESDTDDLDAYSDEPYAAVEHALAHGASAIHVSPQADWYTVRARIDGLVRELGTVSKEDLEPLVERLDTATALRVHITPTKQGDKITLFPREHPTVPTTLVELGLTRDASEALHEALAKPSGAIVVSGPVGSGTTTTLYAALDVLNTPDRIAATIEDPVDRFLDRVDQMEVDDANGVTFAGGLRTLLDTDSDVVLVGEILDRETAEIAFQAAFAGRHVLAALRVPSAATAIRRLMDMELEPSVLGALTCVVAQRLVRRVCGDCRETYYAPDSELAELGQPVEGSGPRLLARGRGCHACDGTGFRGRAGIFEVLSVTDEIRALVSDGASAKKIHRAAVAAGMRTLREDGVRLCLEGVTTTAEVQRILGTET